MINERERIEATYMSGPHDGRTLTWELPGNGDEMIVTIGRREGCDILIDYDSQVSRLHARIIFVKSDRVFFLEDLGSRNGTFIGQTRLREHLRTPLATGELYRVGRTWMRVEPVRTVGDSVPTDDLPF